MRPILSIADVVTQLGEIGVRVGDVLLVHTSFRAAAQIERGPAGLIDALSLSIGSQGALVMPSWTGDDGAPFDPAATPSADDLGVVARTFWQQPGVQRGRHPFAFAARGPKAAEILCDGLVLPPHQQQSPVGRVWRCDGRILLLGVNHDANTTLHLAELLAAVPYRRRMHITVMRDGRPERVDYLENDCCCERFRMMDEAMKAHQSKGMVGHAWSRLVRSRDLVDVALSHLRRDPLVFLHPRDSGCEECVDAWRCLPESA